MTSQGKKILLTLVASGFTLSAAPGSQLCSAGCHQDRSNHTQSVCSAIDDRQIIRISALGSMKCKKTVMET